MTPWKHGHFWSLCIIYVRFPGCNPQRWFWEDTLSFPENHWDDIAHFVSSTPLKTFRRIQQKTPSHPSHQKSPKSPWNCQPIPWVTHHWDSRTFFVYYSPVDSVPWVVFRPGLMNGMGWWWMMQCFRLIYIFSRLINKRSIEIQEFKWGIVGPARFFGVFLGLISVVTLNFEISRPISNKLLPPSYESKSLIVFRTMVPNSCHKFSHFEVDYSESFIYFLNLVKQSLWIRTLFFLLRACFPSATSWKVNHKVLL